MVKTAVVILNWNGKKLLQQFLPSVIQHTPEATIYVADNASKDDSVALLKKHFPQVHILENTENLGFCRGYNEVLRQIDSDYYVLLNNDVEVTENWLTPLVELLESDPSIAACQPKIKAWNNKNTFEYAGAAGGYIDPYSYPFCRGRIFDTLEDDRGQYDDNREVFWATGACLCIRAALYHEMGGFDADFFAHMEEIDLCWRLKNNGYKIYCCGKSEVYHLGGGSLPATSARKTYFNFRNSLVTLYKNAPSKGLIKRLFIRLLIDKTAALHFFITGKWSHSGAVVNAWWHFLTHRKVLRNKRASLAHGLPAPALREALVIAYHVKRKRYFPKLSVR